MEKKNTFWKVLTAILAIGAICAAAAVIYHKFFRKKKEELEAVEELPELEADEGAAAEEEVFEVAADAVIANVEDMEAPEEPVVEA